MLGSSRAQAFAGLAAVAALALAVRWQPSIELLLPDCPIHHWTGLDCPGCGITRAILALLSGRLSDAFSQNLLAPFFCAFGATRCYTAIRRNRWGELHLSPLVMAALMTIVAVFGVVRNIGSY